MENEVGFLITQHPFAKTDFCKADLTEFLLVIEQKFVLYLRKTSHEKRKILQLYTFLFLSGFWEVRVHVSDI